VADLQVPHPGGYASIEGFALDPADTGCGDAVNSSNAMYVPRMVGLPGLTSPT